MEHMLRAFVASLALHGVVANNVQIPLGEAVCTAQQCRNIPGDLGWPEPQLWNQLNQTVRGRLIMTTPAASVCHDPNYDESKCKELTKVWGQARIAARPAEYMSHFFQNNTCTPFTPRSTKCELGNYASYSIDVRSVDDVQAGIRFAQTHNIRLVIKNSGHDFFGHSTGKGALSLWMHNYDKVFLTRDYTSTYYQGPAVHVQAGADAEAVGNYASALGYTIVAGSCPTVKLAGGYIGGGGHSFLSGKYGFAADNALEWEVVTAAGERVVATPTQHADLYWALSGGGGGNYGVVLSVTIRAFPNEVTSNAQFGWNVGQAGGVEQYWNTVRVFHQQLKPLLDQGMVAEYGYTNEGMMVTGIMAPGHTSDSLRSALEPLVSAITAESCSQLTPESLNMRVVQADNYNDLWKVEIAPHLRDLTSGTAAAGRFVPRQAMDADFDKVEGAFRTLAERGLWYAVIALNVQSSVRNRTAPPIASNAVQPDFHRAYSSVMINQPWSNSLPWPEAQARQDQLMNELLPIYDAAVPDAGGYKNEGNWAEKNIKKTFYAGTYERLEQIKKMVDPAGLFYGITSVGFDHFEPDDAGRLCRA